MSDKSNFTDITKTSTNHKLLFCSNCGEKQAKFGQKHCSNCGESYYETKKSELHQDKVKDTDTDDSLAKISGWLLLPYIGFYVTTLFGLVVAAYALVSTQDSTARRVFVELIAIGIVVSAITSIVLIHKRSKTLLSCITILYGLGFILSIDSSLKTHNPVTVITDAIAAAFWIGYFFKSKRVNALLSVKHKSKAAETKHTNATTGKSIVPQVLVVSFIILCVGLFIGIKAYSNHEYKANLNKVSSLNSQLQADYNQLASLPSTTTNTKSGWDSYYQNLNSEVQTIGSDAKTSYSNTALNNFNSDVETASTDFTSYLNLEQSYSDMGFQITGDQSSISSDKGIITEYTDDDITDGEALMAGEISSEQSTLSGDETTLQNDQQTFTNQGTQLKTLDNTVLADLSKLDSDSTSLKP